jgi:iron complex outermembrane receptor protein
VLFTGLPFTSTCDPRFGTIAGVRALPGFARRLDEDNWGAKAQLNWKLDTDLLLYAGVTRGTKAGGFNSAGTYPPQFIVFQPEALVDYEAGVKSRVLGGSTTLNAALFHYDYHNFQTYTADRLGNVYVFNIDAENDGCELTVDARPFAGFSVDLGVTYLHAIEKRVPMPGGYLADQPMPLAPRWRATAMVRYEFELLAGKVAVQTDWQHTAHKSTSAIDSPYSQIPTEDVADAEVSWTRDDGRLQIAARVDNLTGTAAVADRADFTILLGGVGWFYSPPRWYRGTVTYNF